MFLLLETEIIFFSNLNFCYYEMSLLKERADAIKSVISVSVDHARHPVGFLMLVAVVLWCFWHSEN